MKTLWTDDDEGIGFDYCQPLTEQELIDNGLKEKEKEPMEKTIAAWIYGNRDFLAKASLEEILKAIKDEVKIKEEQISEELADKLLSVVGNEVKDIIKNNWKKADYIKESALDKAEKYYERWKDKTENINYNHFDVLYQLYEAAISELKAERKGKE